MSQEGGKAMRRYLTVYIACCRYCGWTGFTVKKNSAWCSRCWQAWWPLYDVEAEEC